MHELGMAMESYVKFMWFQHFTKLALAGIVVYGIFKSIKENSNAK